MISVRSSSLLRPASDVEVGVESLCLDDRLASVRVEVKWSELVMIVVSSSSNDYVWPG